MLIARSRLSRLSGESYFIIRKTRVGFFLLAVTRVVLPFSSRLFSSLLLKAVSDAESRAKTERKNFLSEKAMALVNLPFDLDDDEADDLAAGTSVAVESVCPLPPPLGVTDLPEKFTSENLLPHLVASINTCSRLQLSKSNVVGALSWSNHLDDVLKMVVLTKSWKSASDYHYAKMASATKGSSPWSMLAAHNPAAFASVSLARQQELVSAPRTSSEVDRKRHYSHSAYVSCSVVLVGYSILITHLHSLQFRSVLQDQEGFLYPERHVIRRSCRWRPQKI
jgi:hypothetical protein